MHVRIACISILIASSCSGQSFFVDFESGAIGDPISTFGLFDFVPGDELVIEAVGVGGSNGFQIDVADSPGVFLGAGLFPSFGINRNGDLLTIAVDTQISLDGGSNTIPDQPDVLFDWSLNGASGGGLFSQFTLEEDDNTFGTRHIVFGTDGNLIELGDSLPLANLGIGDGFLGTSPFFRFEMEILRQEADSHLLTTSVLDTSGNVLLRQSSNVNLEGFFDSSSLPAISFTNFTRNDYHEWVRVDNFSYSVVQVPEPSASLGMMMALMVFMLRGGMESRHATSDSKTELIAV